MLASACTSRTSRSTGSVYKQPFNTSVFTASEIIRDLQAALQRSQEVQGLRQLQADQACQGGPTDPRDGDECKQITYSFTIIQQLNQNHTKLKCSPSLLGHPRSQEVQKDQKDPVGPETDKGAVFKYSQTGHYCNINVSDCRGISWQSFNSMITPVIKIYPIKPDVLP